MCAGQSVGRETNEQTLCVGTFVERVCECVCWCGDDSNTECQKLGVTAPAIVQEQRIIIIKDTTRAQRAHIKHKRENNLNLKTEIKSPRCAVAAVRARIARVLMLARRAIHVSAFLVSAFHDINVFQLR